MKFDAKLIIGLVLIVFVGCDRSSQGNLWEHQSQGIKQPNWVYCDKQNELFYACYKESSNNPPETLPDHFVLTKKIGDTEQDLHPEALESITYARSSGRVFRYKGDEFLDLFSALPAPKSDPNEIWTVVFLSEECATEAGLEPVVSTIGGGMRVSSYVVEAYGENPPWCRSIDEDCMHTLQNILTIPGGGCYKIASLIAE